MTNSGQGNYSVDDLASYFQYQASTFGTDYTSANDASNPVLQTLDSVANVNTSIVVPSGDFSAAGFGGSISNFFGLNNVPLIDLLSGSTFSANFTDLLQNNPVIYSPSAGTYALKDLTADPNYVPFSQIAQFYVANAASIAAYNIGTNSTFWTSSPEAEKIYNYLNDITNVYLSTVGIYQGNPTGFNPPANLARLIGTYELLNVYTGSPSSFNTTNNSANAANTEPAFTISTVANPSTSAVLSNVLSTFLSNYTTLYPPPSGGVTPADFIQNWTNYLNSNAAQPTKPNSIGVDLELVGQEGGSTVSVSAGTVTANLSGITIPSGTKLISSNLITPEQANNFSNQLFTQYQSALKVSTDWQGLTIDTAAEEQQLFLNAFNYFIQNVSNNSAIASNGQSFFQMWSEFIGPTTFLQNSTITSATSELNTYQQLYNTFYPGQESSFITNLNTFIQNILSQPSGVFNPSLFLDQWIAQLQKGFNDTSTVLDQANFSATQLIGEVFNSINNFISDLQNLTLAQATRLNFYSSYQQNYTNSISEITFFNPGDSSPIGKAPVDNVYHWVIDNNGDYQTITLPSNSAYIPNSANYQYSVDNPTFDLEYAQYRLTANQAASSWVQNLQNFRSEVGNKAQAVQTQIQNSNSNVNQQADIASYILQLYNQLIASIFSNIQANQQSSKG